MRSKLVELQEAVIERARAVAAPDEWPATANDHLAMGDLQKALDALDAHIEEITNERGAHNHTQTSFDAAELAVPAVGTVRRSIIDEIRARTRFSDAPHPHNGLTDDQLERILKRAHTTISSARNSLVEKGWLKASAYIRKTALNRDAVVWVLTPAALAKMNSPEWAERKR